MKKIGFWKEYRPELSEKTLLSEFDSNIDPKSDYSFELIDYLESGIKLTGLRCEFECLLTREEIEGTYTYTDGEWVWTSELIHYVKYHRLKIPEELLSHMAENGYAIPSIEEIGVKRLEYITNSLM